MCSDLLSKVIDTPIQLGQRCHVGVGAFLGGHLS
jgi:hypothetical protein